MDDGLMSVSASYIATAAHPNQALNMAVKKHTVTSGSCKTAVAIWVSTDTCAVHSEVYDT